MTTPLTLYCLPHAGGAASAFRGWSLDEVAVAGRPVRVVPVQYPGREGRFARPCVDRMPALVEDLREEYRFGKTTPYAFYGHSMGAGTALELCRALERDGEPLPEALAVSGQRPPHLRGAPRALHLLPDDELIDELVRMNGTPPEVLENRDLLRIVLPMVRNDFRLLYHYRVEEAPVVPVPVLALAGTEDRAASPEDVALWEHCTTRTFRYAKFPGDHFFVRTEHAEVLRAIANFLAEVAYGPSCAPGARREKTLGGTP